MSKTEEGGMRWIWLLSVAHNLKFVNGVFLKFSCKFFRLWFPTLKWTKEGETVGMGGLLHSPTMESHSAFKRKEVPIPVATQRNPEDVTFTERTQSKKTNSAWFHFDDFSIVVRSQKRRVDAGCQEWGRKEQELWNKGFRSSTLPHEESYGWTMVLFVNY